jgi:hypothetical protein
LKANENRGLPAMALKLLVFDEMLQDNNENRRLASQSYRMVVFHDMFIENQ